MFLTKKLIDFLSGNKGKRKNEVIELMMKEFNYKKSTAISRYSDYSDESTSFKKIAFDFFKNNPYALEESDNKIHSKELKMPIVTYTVYKSKYKVEQKNKN